MDPVKVKGVQNWPLPTNKREVQSFLGFCNFYRCFVKGFMLIAKPLTRLTGNDTFLWTDTHTRAFEGLRDTLMMAPTLRIPNPNAPFHLETDVSAYAVGAVLSQPTEGHWHPMAFMSKAMTETQHNYEVYDRELLAIMTAIEEFHRYLIGTSEPFEIWTDHANLQYFRAPQKLNQ